MRCDASTLVSFPFFPSFCAQDGETMGVKLPCDDDAGDRYHTFVSTRAKKRVSVPHYEEEGEGKFTVCSTGSELPFFSLHSSHLHSVQLPVRANLCSAISSNDNDGE